MPALRDGDELVYETGAVLLYLVERLPGRGLGPLPGEPGRGALLRWVTWLADTLHGAYHPLDAPRFLTDDPAGYEGIRLKGREKLDAHGAYLERELTGRTWCLGDEFSVADIYLYMLKGWESYSDGYTLGGEHLAAPLRAGRRPARDRPRARARRPRRAAAPLSPRVARRDADRLSGGEATAARRRARPQPSAGSTFPPETTSTIGPSAATTAPVRSAASVSAAVGSTRSLASSASQRIASSTASSGTVTISSTSAAIVANVSSPSACVRTPSQIVRVTSAAGQRDDAALAQRLLGVGGELGLDADHAGIRAQRLDRRRDARDQAAAADADDDGGDLGKVLRDLEPHRPLAGDDPRVVERRDVLERARVADLGRHALALLARVGAAHDLGAERRSARNLDGGGVLRHHDRRRHAVQRGSGGDALRVVAARVGDDAALDRRRTASTQAR